jgi:hypothetical protein
MEICTSGAVGMFYYPEIFVVIFLKYQNYIVFITMKKIGIAEV